MDFSKENWEYWEFENGQIVKKTPHKMMKFPRKSRQFLSGFSFTPLSPLFFLKISIKMAKLLNEVFGYFYFLSTDKNKCAKVDFEDRNSQIAHCVIVVGMYLNHTYTMSSNVPFWTPPRDDAPKTVFAWGYLYFQEWKTKRRGQWCCFAFAKLNFKMCQTHFFPTGLAWD